MSVASFQRTLDQELVALVRGISLECMVCGEFVLQAERAIACPECRSILAAGVDLPEVAIPSVVQAG